MKLKIVFAAALATLTIASCGQKGTGASSELLPAALRMRSASMFSSGSLLALTTFRESSVIAPTASVAAMWRFGARL